VNAQVSVEAQESEYLSLGMMGFAKLIQIAQQSFGTSISCESSIERAKHHLELQKVDSYSASVQCHFQLNTSIRFIQISSDNWWIEQGKWLPRTQYFTSI
jgi:hypothetical protein